MDESARQIDLELSFRKAPVALCVVDRDLRFLRVNDALAALNGLAPEDMVGKTVREVAPVIAELVEGPYRRVFAEGGPLLNLEFHNPAPARPDDVRDWLVSFHPLADEGGEVTAVSTSIQEITAQKAVERRLRQSEERYAAAIAAGESGVFVADLESGADANYVDPVARALLGVDPDELLGPVGIWARVLTAEDREQVAREVTRHVEAGTPLFEYEAKLLRPEGARERWMAIRGRARRGPDGRIVRVLGTVTDITRRKSTELELARYRDDLETLLAQRTATVRALNARLQALIESSIIGVMIADRNGVIRDANDAFLRLVGHDREELPLDWLCLTAPEAADEDRGVFRGVAERGYAAPWEREVLHRDGRRLTVLIGLAKILDSPDECVAFVVDRTEQKRAERAARESAERARALTAASPDMILRVSEAGTILDFRSDVPLFPGEDPVLVLGRRIADLPFPRAVREAAMAGIRRALREEGTIEVDLPIRRGGEVRHYEARVVRSGPDDVVGILRDVTERRAAEEALRRSEERFRRLVERSWDAISVMSGDGTCLYASPGLVRILGRSDTEYVGQVMYDYCHRDDVPLATRRVEEVLAAPGRVVSAEVRVRREDGAWRWLEVVATNLLDDGAVQGIVLNARDVTERRAALDFLRLEKMSLSQRVAAHTASLAHATRQLEEEIQSRREAEAQLRRAERLASIGTLAAGIAHEINNPLAAISAAAELAHAEAERSGAQERLLRSLSQIVEQAQRGGRIVRSVLRFSREGQTPRMPEDLAEIARRAVDVLRAEVARAGFAVRFDLATEVVLVLANAVELEQVVTNLLRNAVQAGASEVRVSVRAERRQAQLEVADDGRGMDSREVGRIFDPFYTTRQADGGTGLGLSVAHGIVGQHGGAIGVRSAPWSGTTIVVDLPLVRIEGARPLRE